MGRAKDEWMEHESKVEHARMICKEFGAIEECKVHEGVYTDTLEYMDYEELTATILENSPNAIDSFEDREDMVTCITEAMTSTGDECGCCDRD